VDGLIPAEKMLNKFKKEQLSLYDYIWFCCNLYCSKIEAPFKKYIQELFIMLSRNNKLNLDIFKMIFNYVVIPNSGMSITQISSFLNQFDNGSNGRPNKKSRTTPSSGY
jgi:hypothetical protein